MKNKTLKKTAETEKIVKKPAKRKPVKKSPRARKAVIKHTPSPTFLEAIDHDAFCLPLFSIGRSILRNYRENLPPIFEGELQKINPPPRFEQNDPFFILERFGERTIAFPTKELSQILSDLLRGNQDAKILETTDALLFLSLKPLLPPPSDSDSESATHWREDFLQLEKKAVDILCQTLAAEAASFYTRPLGAEVPDAQSKPVAYFKKVIGTIRRLRKAEYANSSSMLPKSIFIIESARILTERDAELPTKTQVRQLMDSKGWGMGKTNDGARKWKKAWNDSGLNSLSE